MSKHFFLISFLPAIAYWYLESYYEPRIAAIGGVILAVVEIIVEKIFFKEVHAISKANFFLIVLLGGLSFLDNQGVWFKLQPCFTGVGIGVFLIFKVLTGSSLMFEMMQSFADKNRLPPMAIMKKFEFHVALFFMIYGLFMGWVALYFTTGQWTFFKTIGFYIMSAIFFVFELVWLKLSIKRYALKSQTQAFKRF